MVGHAPATRRGVPDLWYALPVVDTAPDFHTVMSCVYNVFESGQGQIVSGRVVDMAGRPMDAVEVTLETAGDPPRTCTTPDNGIFAFAAVPSWADCTLTARKPPHTFHRLHAATTAGGIYASGNCWGLEFRSGAGGPPTAHDQDVSVVAGHSVDIALAALDDGLPDPPGRMQYRIVTGPRHGRLIDPATGQIEQYPHTLADDGSKVCYQPCSYYAGIDQFAFVADDGGIPPAAGPPSFAMALRSPRPAGGTSISTAPSRTTARATS